MDIDFESSTEPIYYFGISLFVDRMELGRLWHFTPR